MYENKTTKNKDKMMLEIHVPQIVGRYQKK